LFEWWKDVFRPLRIEDRDFGRMRFLRQTSTWECQAHFPPIDGPVEVLIEGDSTGPTASQRETWQALASHYARLADEARALIQKAVEAQQVDGFELHLAAISLPRDSASRYELELTFGNRSGPPQFDVRVASWRVQDVLGPL
jgi:hypothetical protein